MQLIDINNKFKTCKTKKDLKKHDENENCFENQLRNDNYSYNSNQEHQNNFKRPNNIERFGGKAPFSYLNENNEEDDENENNDSVGLIFNSINILNRISTTLNNRTII